MRHFEGAVGPKRPEHGEANHQEIAKLAGGALPNRDSGHIAESAALEAVGHRFEKLCQ